MKTARGRATTAAGTRALLRFLLRRERRNLPWWVLGTGLLVLFQSTQSQRFYDSPEALAQLRETMGGNAAVVALSGPTELLRSIGGEVVFEIFSYVAIVVALMSMFLVGRHTRGDEETGRAELIRSARIGRHAPLGAALWLAGLANIAAGIAVFAAAAGTGLPVLGSVLLGVATAAVGITFAGLTAVAAQVFSSARAVYGAVGVALGAAFVLRAMGDVGDGTLSWLSPIGWSQRTFPYAGDRWWPLLLPLAAVTLLVGAAGALLDRRDFGAGLVPTRPGRASGSPALGTASGLAWRLQRNSLAGWTAGVLVLGAAYGSFGESIETFVAKNPQIADFLPGGADDVIDSYLALTIMICALITTAFGVSSALYARGEETSGRAELVLASPTSRQRWLGGHMGVALVGSALALLAAGFGEGAAYGLATSDLGQIPRLMAVALVYLPAVWLIIGLAAVGVAWLPRAAAGLAWAALGYCAVIALFADSFGLPDWTRWISPFDGTPQVPLETLGMGPVSLIGVIAAVLFALAFVGIRRRDLG